MKQTPQLGNVVRDITTGLAGIAFQYVELITGTVQLAIQPQLKKGEAYVTTTAEGIPPGLNVDLALLDYVADGIFDRVAPAAPTDIALGNKVEDIASGLVGIAISRVTFINGCVYYNVQPGQTDKQKKEGEFSLPSFLPGARLKKLADGIAKQMAPALTAPAEKRPGGPSTRAQRA